MSLQLHFGRDSRNNAPVIMAQPEPEPLDAMEIMRLLHAHYPSEWAIVDREIVTPPDKKLILNGELPQG